MLKDTGSIDWFKDAIVYHILIDRFAGFKKTNNWEKPVFIGGKINGITKKLSYLEELGINTIWLSPFFKNTDYHGYHITDYFKVDNRFGTYDDLQELISEAHKRNIRIIADFVPNHCSRNHPFFIDAVNNVSSPYRRWFYFDWWPDNYRCFLHFKNLPKWNLDYPPCRNYMIEAAKFWLGQGIDGFRLDHVIGVSHSFWKQFRQKIKSIYPEAVLIGEAWFEGISYKHLKTLNINRKFMRWLFGINVTKLQKEYMGELDGVLDFNFRHRIIEYIAWKENPEFYQTKLTETLNKFRMNFPEDYFLPTFVENHDMSRFLFECGQNREKLKLALKTQFSLSQPPVLYYGTETGLTHINPVDLSVHFSDIQARKPMNWKSIDYELLEFCKTLIADRKGT